MIDFFNIQKELIVSKVLIYNNGLQRNTTWKKFDISKYNVSQKEFWYRVLHPEVECVCSFCKKPINFNQCYITSKDELFCSKDEVYKLAYEKRKKTNIELYGSEAVLNNEEKKQKCKSSWHNKSSDEKEKINKKRFDTIISKYETVENFYKECHNKSVETNLKRYGVSSPFKNKQVKEKIKETCRKKYGFDYASQSKEVKEKIKETCLNNFGVSCIFKSADIRNKSMLSLRQDLYKYAENNDLILASDLEYGNGWILAKIVPTVFYKGYNFIKKSDLCKIEEYFAKGKDHSKSHKELELQDFIKSLNVKYEFNSRQVISPKELDIFLPDNKVAIEFDGIFWHSSLQKSVNYHLDKTKNCLIKGIRLIHVFEDEWTNSSEIIKSIIKSSIGKYDEKIYARNCILKEISQKDYKEFLTKNHLQGPVNSSIRYGLFYENELVQVAGFGKSRFKKDELELHRMCTKLNTQVVGGFSKMCKYLNKPFVSYIDRSKYTGSGYKAIGFKFLKETPPSYSYFYKDSMKRFNRISFQKSKLKNMKSYSSEKTESEIMYEEGFLKVYDCGTIKVEYGS